MPVKFAPKKVVPDWTGDQAAMDVMTLGVADPDLVMVRVEKSMVNVPLVWAVRFRVMAKPPIVNEWAEFPAADIVKVTTGKVG
jgi:hypothetical protein